MPKIKQITAEGQAATLNVSDRRAPVESFEGVDFLGKSITEIGQNLGLIAGGMAREDTILADRAAKVAEKLAKQQDDLDIMRDSRQAEADVTALKNDLPMLEPDAAKRAAFFVENAQKIHDKYLTNARNPNVRRGIEMHILSKFPLMALGVRDDSRKVIFAQQNAELDTLAEAMSSEAATKSPEEMREYTNSYSELVQRRRAAGSMDGKEAEIRIRKFVSDTQEKQMKILLDSDNFTALRQRVRDGVYNAVSSDKQYDILDKANNKQHTLDQRRDAAATKVRHMAMETYWDAANHGSLDKGQLERDPLILHHEKAALIHRNEHPIFGVADASLAVKTLKQQYVLEMGEGGRTLEIVNKYRMLLNRLNLDLGNKVSDDIIKFGEELKQDSTAARNTNAAEIGANVQRYREDSKAHTPLTGFTAIDKLNAPKRKQEEGEDLGAIQRGAKADEVLKRRLEKRKQERDSITGSRKTIQDLLKAR